MAMVNANVAPKGKVGGQKVSSRGRNLRPKRRESTERLSSQAVADIAGALKLLGQSTRFKLAVALLEGPRNVKELCEHIQCSQPAVSHHLAFLRLNGLFTREQRGKKRFYELADGVRELIECAIRLRGSTNP